MNRVTYIAVTFFKAFEKVFMMADLYLNLFIPEPGTPEALWYLKLSLHERVKFKQSYYESADKSRQ